MHSTHTVILRARVRQAVRGKERECERGRDLVHDRRVRTEDGEALVGGDPRGIKGRITENGLYTIAAARAIPPRIRPLVKAIRNRPTV